MFLSSGYALAEQYPATDYKPKVLYQDKELIEKHTEAAKTRVVPEAKATAEEKSTSASAGSSEGAVESKKGDSDDNSMLLILVVVAGVAGFVLFNKSKGTSSATAGQYKVYAADPSGLTGVARYLKQQEEASKTGVQKYLDKQEVQVAAGDTAEEQANKTGVEKYLEKKVEESATGVEKYIRKNG